MLQTLPGSLSLTDAAKITRGSRTDFFYTALGIQHDNSSHINTGDTDRAVTQSEVVFTHRWNPLATEVLSTFRTLWWFVASHVSERASSQENIPHTITQPPPA